VFRGTPTTGDRESVHGDRHVRTVMCGGTPRAKYRTVDRSSQALPAAPPARLRPPRGNPHKTTRHVLHGRQTPYPGRRQRARIGSLNPTSFAVSAKGNIMNKLLKGSIAGAAGIA